MTSPHGATRYAASRHTTTNYQLASPPTNKKPTNKAAGRVTTAHSKIEAILYLQGTQVVEKGFNQTWVGALRLQFYSTKLVGVDGQHAMTAKVDGQNAMTAKPTTQLLKRPIDDSRSHSQCFTAELMSYYADSATPFMHAATPPAGATPPSGGRAI